VSNILTYLLSCTVSKLWPIICQIFASDRGVPHINALRYGPSPANIRMNFTSQETRMIVLADAKIARSYLHSSGQNARMWRKDRRTDRNMVWLFQQSALLAIRMRC